MPDMNPELLKQLLAEFEEKQAVTTEEINEIEKQIEELRARIELSRDRLQEVERDREKVGAMKARYAEGDWTSVLQDLSRMKAQTAPEPEPVKRAPEPAIAKAERSSKKGKSGVSEVSDNGSGKNAEPAVAQPAPVPTPPVPPPQMEAAPEAPPTPPSPPPLAPTMEMEMPQTLPTPAAPPNEGGLFPFSQAEQAGDMPWAPTPAMSWDSVNAQSFPTDSSETPQAGFAHTPDGNNPFLESAAKLGIPSPQSYGQPPQAPQGFNPPQGFGAPDAPGGAPMPPAAPSGAPAQAGSHGSPDVLSTAFDEEFDIAAALRGENEPGSEKEEGDVKKINDALRGLFS